MKKYIFDKNVYMQSMGHMGYDDDPIYKDPKYWVNLCHNKEVTFLDRDNHDGFISTDRGTYLISEKWCRIEED